LLNDGINPTAKAAVVAGALSGGGCAMAGAGCSIGVAVEVIRNTEALKKAAAAAKEDVPHAEQQQMWKQINVGGV
jgi:hypothetical protein